MMRVELAASDDAVALAGLALAIEELGGVPADGDEWGPPGTGLNRYRCGGDELTVFVDAWAVDVAGPDELVKRVLAKLAE
jgi:hypothetical protein